MRITHEKVMSHCKFYGKYDLQYLENLPDVYKMNVAVQNWHVEKIWADDMLRCGSRAFRGELRAYSFHGLDEFNSEDGVPKTLKAMFYASYISKRLEMSDVAEAFKSYYINDYLNFSI